MTVDEALNLIRAEYNRARAKHAPMNSAHEGYAVLKEEVDELWDDVKAALQRVANRYPDDADRGMLEASAIIKEFGYTVVRDIKPEHFAPIVARVAAHLAA